MTSMDTDADVKQLGLPPWLTRGLIIVLCVVVGAVIGYFINEDKIRQFVNRKSDAQQVVIDTLEGDREKLEEEKKELQAQIQELEGTIGELENEVENLNSQIAVLSDTVNQKTESENALLAQIESQKIPTEYPLTGSATLDEGAGTDISVFTASEGSTIVATAAGTVTAVNDDGEFGHNVWIDHGNGYITIYRNGGNAIVRLGDEVVPGTAIFVIGSKNTKFGYQIIKDDAYINPMDMLSING